MADFVDNRRQIQQQQTQQHSNTDSKKDLFKNVPDLVEERRKDQDGNPYVANKFTKGTLLGKVRGYVHVFLFLLRFSCTGWLCSSIFE
jgi:hypothetical protein